MKTILTTIFTIAVMAFAFNANPVMATEEEQCWWMESLQKCAKYKDQAQVDDVQDPDQADGERDVADSGEEGSTSAAGATEQ
ncbi:MAG: hypothetical protein OXF09_04840 [Hyphomicrobiales bacterium]|nr:hypothetical protein [Hyphomicrobiales bacterium]